MSTDTIASDSERQSTETGRTPRSPLLINRNFALLWSGQTISFLGDSIFNTTLVLWIAIVLARGQIWAPLAVSGVLLATAIPTFIIGPVAGVFADRWDKRRTMMSMDALRAGLIALLLLAAGLPFVVGPRFIAPQLAIFWQLGSIYSIVLLTSICDQFFSPSLVSLTGDIVAEQDQPRASSLNQIVTSLAFLVGPPLGTLLFFAVGVQVALLFDALSFVVSFLALMAIRAPKATVSIEEGQQANFLREFIGGLRFYSSNRVLMTILITGVLIRLGAGALNALDIFFVTQNLHTSASLYGLLGSFYGIGAIAGAILAGLFVRRIGIVKSFCLSIVMLGILVLVYARLTIFAPALVVLFLVGMSDATINVTVMPLFYHVTPKEFRGRAMATLIPMMSLASLLSIAIAGSLASTVLGGLHTTLLGITIGPVDTIFTATGILILAGACYSVVNMRGVKMEESS